MTNKKQFVPVNISITLPLHLWEQVRHAVQMRVAALHEGSPHNALADDALDAIINGIREGVAKHREDK